MLYTSRPLERIYHDHNKPKEEPGKESNVKKEFREVPLTSGRMVAKRNGDNYLVDHISSTDMSDYLNYEYAPGSILKK